VFDTIQLIISEAMHTLPGKNSLMSMAKL